MNLLTHVDDTLLLRNTEEEVNLLCRRLLNMSKKSGSYVKDEKTEYQRLFKKKRALTKS